MSKILPVSVALRSTLLVAVPRVIQAFIAGLGDFFTWLLATKIYPDGNASSFVVGSPPLLLSPMLYTGSFLTFRQLFLQILSPWQWFCSVRTFSNSLEMTLTVMALYVYPWEQLLGTAKITKENPRPVNPLLYNRWPLRSALCLASLAVILRPTNLFIWAPIIGLSIFRTGLLGPSPVTFNVILLILQEIIVCGSVVLGISLACDRLYFGFWTFPPYNFLYFNVSKSLSVFYGVNPWHYYLLQGLPLLCTTILPFFLYALYRYPASSDDQTNYFRAMVSVIATTIIPLSFISHKEVRFIYPLLPILHILAAPVAASFFTSKTSPSSPDPTPSLRHKPYFVAILAINLLLAGYLSLLHQGAPLKVLTFLREQYEHIHPAVIAGDSTSAASDDLFALFLTPCHTTPWRSHLVHPTLRAYALSCEPPLHTEPNTRERDSYRDEADRFYDDPVGFLARELFPAEGGVPTPRYIVGFEGIEPWLADFLENTPQGRALRVQPRPVWVGFNGFFNEDWRRAGRLVVWDTGIYGDASTAES